MQLHSPCIFAPVIKVLVEPLDVVVEEQCSCPNFPLVLDLTIIKYVEFVMECVFNVCESAVKSEDFLSNLVLIVDLAPLEKESIGIE